MLQASDNKCTMTLKRKFKFLLPNIAEKEVARRDNVYFSVCLLLCLLFCLCPSPSPLKTKCYCWREKILKINYILVG